MKKLRIVLLLGCMMMAVSAYSQDPVFFEEFDNGMGSWWVGFQEGGEGTSEIDGSGVLSGLNSLFINIQNGGSYDYSVLALGKVNLEQGKTYDLYFQAISDPEISVTVVFSQDGGAYATYVSFAHVIGGEQDHFGPYTWKCDRADGNFDLKWMLGKHNDAIVYIDSVVVVEHVDTDVGGCCPDAVNTLPNQCVLVQNYPNPFNPSTTIPYELSIQADVSLRVYNLNGQLVRTLVQNTQGAGVYQVTWDGSDMTGRAVSSGIYICRIEVKDNALRYSDSQKMFLMK